MPVCTVRADPAGIFQRAGGGTAAGGDWKPFLLSWASGYVRSSSFAGISGDRETVILWHIQAGAGAVNRDGGCICSALAGKKPKLFGKIGIVFTGIVEFVILLMGLGLEI